MKDFILLAEAEKLTGKSRTTLNRLANQFPEYTKRESSKILINKKFLLSKYSKMVKHTDSNKINHEQDLINQLRAENEYLREQNKELIQVLANLKLTVTKVEQVRDKEELTTINQDEPKRLTTANQKVSKYSEEVRKQALELKEEGLTQAEIGRRLDIPRSTVRGWLKK